MIGSQQCRSIVCKAARNNDEEGETTPGKFISSGFSRGTPHQRRRERPGGTRTEVLRHLGRLKEDR